MNNPDESNLLCKCCLREPHLERVVGLLGNTGQMLGNGASESQPSDEESWLCKSEKGSPFRSDLTIYPSSQQTVQLCVHEEEVLQECAECDPAFTGALGLDVKFDLRV